MENFSEALAEFLCGVFPDIDQAQLDEIATRSDVKFRARMKANKRSMKKFKRTGHLAPSKYLKKYGDRWRNLKEEWEVKSTTRKDVKPEDKMETGEKWVGKKKPKPINELSTKTLNQYQIRAYVNKKETERHRDYYKRGAEFWDKEKDTTRVKNNQKDADNADRIVQKRERGMSSAFDAKMRNRKYTKANREAAEIRRVDEATTMTAKGAAKWERKTKNKIKKNALRNTDAKKEMRNNDVPFTSVPYGMNAGMRMHSEDTITNED